MIENWVASIESLRNTGLIENSCVSPVVILVFERLFSFKGFSRCTAPSPTRYPQISFLADLYSLKEPCFPVCGEETWVYAKPFGRLRPARNTGACRNAEKPIHAPYVVQTSCMQLLCKVNHQTR
ncbi:hypothetical protein TNCV_4505881 [Trichonephila clavipes]|nr:hypothetical protein TNCV_4505881 [Trichonephila clavipes]